MNPHNYGMPLLLCLILCSLGHALEIQSGDVILERVRTSFGAGVEGATGTEWAHVGFVEKDQNGEIRFLEATIPRAQKIPLQKLVKRSKGRLALVRIPSLTKKEIQSVLQYANQQMGKPYDRLFRLHEQESLYCSELIWAGLEAGTDTERMPATPMDFSGAWDYWTKWFGNEPIPQGEPGVAPSDILNVPGAVMLHHYRENPTSDLLIPEASGLFEELYQ